MKYKHFFSLHSPLFSLMAVALLATVLLSACSKEEDNTPSMADKDRMEDLIDKNIEKIVQFRDNYGTYILYDFDQNLDFAYQFEQAANWTDAELTRIDANEAATAVDALYSDLFACYSDEYKKEYYPRKILLVEDIQSASELGLSVPEQEHHTAVANINSATLAGLGKTLTANGGTTIDASHLKEMHRALLTDYLVKGRGVFPVEENYLSLSEKYYSALMDPNRKNASQLVRNDPDFFYNHGFFFPEEDESTYFPSAEDDIIAFIRTMITMDKALADTLMDKPLMADKMHLITAGLQAMGVDVIGINPWAEQFLLMEHIQPATMYANDVVTDSPEANMDVTIIRGSHKLSHLVVNVNGDDVQDIDLTAYDKMRVLLPIHFTGLSKGINAVKLSLYEEGRERATILTTGINRASMDKVAGFKINCSNDTTDVYRKIKMSYGSDEVLHTDGKGIVYDANLTTISFEKHGWMDESRYEHDYTYMGWKIKKDANGRVITIQELEGSFNSTNSDLIYKTTKTYNLTYNAEGELSAVNQIGGGKFGAIVTDVVYENGRIVSFKYDGKEYVPQYATVNGVTTRIDVMDSKLTGRRFGFKGTEDLNFYYMPELPAVFPGSVAEIPLQLFYSQYLFESIDGVWNDGWHTVTSSGAMARQAYVTLDGAKWTFTLALE